MSRGIRLSEKHGVNPSMGVCFYCGEDDGTIILPGRLKNDVEAPRRAVWSKEPCAKCKELMRQGVMLLEVRDGESGENPYRTGRMWVLKDEALRRMVNPEAAEAGIRHRVMFLEEQTAKMIGLHDQPATP